MSNVHTVGADELEAVMSAYQQRVRDLYQVLYLNLVDSDGSVGGATQRFAAGLAMARLARDIALEEVIHE